MNEILFNEKLEEKIDYIRKSLKSKAQEYSTPKDVYLNFEKAAEISGQSAEDVMFNYMLKHFTSYIVMLEEIRNDYSKQYTEEYLKEKFGDIINYFILSEIYFLHYRNLNYKK